METEKEKKLFFWTLKLYTISFNHSLSKPTFSGVYSKFESFLPLIYKLGKVDILVYRCFCVCSNWTQFHAELTSLKGTFQKNDYPENFIDKFLKMFLKDIHLGKENVPTLAQKEFASIHFILWNNIFTNSN